MWNTSFLFALYSKAVWKPTFYNVKKITSYIKCSLNNIDNLISKAIHSKGRV